MASRASATVESLSYHSKVLAISLQLRISRSVPEVLEGPTFDQKAQCPVPLVAGFNRASKSIVLPV
jgi:hypothetical protein